MHGQKTLQPRGFLHCLHDYFSLFTSDYGDDLISDDVGYAAKVLTGQWIEAMAANKSAMKRSKQQEWDRLPFAPRAIEVVRFFPEQMVSMSPKMKCEVCKDLDVMLEFHALVDKYYETCRPTSAGSVTARSTGKYEKASRLKKPSPLGTNKE